MGGRTLYDEATRRRAIALFDGGVGYRAAAGLLVIPRGTVRQWLGTYRSAGIEVLVMTGKRHAAYSFETKPAAVRAVADEGMSKPEAMAKFGIASPRTNAPVPFVVPKPLQRAGISRKILSFIPV